MSQDISTKLRAKDIRTRGLSEKDFTTNIEANFLSYLFNKQNNVVITSNVYSGQALNGATGNNSKRVTIPIGQTGVTSYVRWDIQVTQFPNWSELIGIPVVFSYKVLTSANFHPTRLLSSKLDVVRAGSAVSQTPTNNTITVLSDTVLLVQFTYTPTLTDQTFRPILQMPPSASAVTEASFYEVQEITYSYSVPVSLAKYEETVLTVSPDGTKNFLTPKLANDSISNSSKSRPYRILVYPGNYPETTQITVKPFTVIEAVQRGTAILSCTLPDNSTDSQIDNTSTILLTKTAGLKGLIITGEKVRYPIHSEEGGLNPNQTHRVEGCHVVHYGNQKARDWRTANPGSGMSAGTVWFSEHAYGYGSASGLVTEILNCTFVAPYTGFYFHTNVDFMRPNLNYAQGCTFVKTGAFGICIGLEPLGSGQPDMLELTNVNVSGGYIRQYDAIWKTALAINQKANHAEISVHVRGGNAVGYLDATRGRAFRITSNNTSGSSTVRLSGTAMTAICGFVYEKDGAGGLKGYTYGNWDISGILVGPSGSTETTNTIGRRLGNCSVTNKTLTVIIDGGSAINIVFNTDLTAVPNVTILSTINTALGSAGVADEFSSADLQYPQMYERQLFLKNDTANGIARFSTVAFDTHRQNVRSCTSADVAASFIGIALENINPGAFGRILTEGVMRYSQTIGLAAGSVFYTTAIQLHASTTGNLATGSTKQIGKGVAPDWFYFKGSI